MLDMTRCRRVIQLDTALDVKDGTRSEVRRRS
jgi:hypothetical protein